MPNGHMTLQATHLLEAIEVFGGECDGRLQTNARDARRALAAVEYIDCRAAVSRALLPGLRKAILDLKNAALTPRPKPRA